MTVEIEIEAISEADALIQLDYQMESDHTQSYGGREWPDGVQVTGRCPIADWNVTAPPIAVAEEREP